MNATIQPPAARGRPLLPVCGVVSLLDKDEDQVLRMVDEGDLLWAWDVALQPERARRKELRVLPECVEDHLAGRKCRLEWPDVLGLILPHDRTVLETGEIERPLNVSGTHVFALARRRCLKVARKGRVGPGGSMRVTAFSFVQFLKARRYPFAGD